MKVMYRIYLVLLIIFHSFIAFSYSVFKENGKVGLKNEEGKVVIPAQYEEIGWSNGAFSVIGNVTGYRTGNRWGLVNLDNHKVTKAQFEELQPGESNLIVARKKGMNSLHLFSGCINTSGKEIIPFIYDGITINALRAVVFTKIGNQYKFGLIDLQNKTIIPQQYQEVKSIGTLRFAVKNFEGKTALFTDLGKQITDFTIDSISSFQKGYAILYQGIYKGLIDRNGEQKLEAKYREIDWDEGGRIRIKEANEWSFLDGNNKLIRQVKADSVLFDASGLYRLETAGEVRIVDEKLAPALPGAFTKVGKFNNGKAIFRMGSLAGVMRQDGSVILPPAYSDIVIGNDYIIANQGKGSKKNLIFFDGSGVRKSVKTYDEIIPTPSGNLRVYSRGFWGVLSREGKEVLGCVYDSLIELGKEHAVVKFKGTYGAIDYSEHWIISPRTNKIQIVHDDRFLEFSPSSTNLKSFNGSVIYFTTNKLVVQRDGILEYHSDGTIWKIDFNGVIVNREEVPLQATEKIYEESEGYRAIKRNGRYGFIDSRGRLRIANRYEGVQPFKEGFAAVKILGKWGFINIQDNLSVQPVYEEVFPFRNGFALVKQKGLFGVIDTKGKLILPVRYEKIEFLNSRKIVVQQNALRGLADETGKILINPRFDYIHDAANGFVIVGRNNKYGVINYGGLSTVPLIYDHISYDPTHDVFLGMKNSSWQEVKL